MFSQLSFRLWFTILVFFNVCCTRSYAQVASAELSGAVTDASGAAVSRRQSQGDSTPEPTRSMTPPAMPRATSSSRCFRRAITLYRGSRGFRKLVQAASHCRSTSRRGSI